MTWSCDENLHSKISPTPGRFLTKGPEPPTVSVSEFLSNCGFWGEFWGIFPGAHVGKTIEFH